MNFLLCGFGAFFFVQCLKLAVPIHWDPLVKLVFVLVGSCGASALAFKSFGVDVLVCGVAGAGLAVLIHRVCRLFMTVGDWFAIEIMLKRSRNR